MVRTRRANYIINRYVTPNVPSQLRSPATIQGTSSLPQVTWLEGSHRQEGPPNRRLFCERDGRNIVGAAKQSDPNLSKEKGASNRINCWLKVPCRDSLRSYVGRLPALIAICGMYRIERNEWVDCLAGMQSFELPIEHSLYREFEFPSLVESDSNST